MDHQVTPKSFYVYGILDSLIIFPIVATANGLLYSRFMTREASRGQASPHRASFQPVHGLAENAGPSF
jgi:hypothetical protein